MGAAHAADPRKRGASGANVRIPAGRGHVEGVLSLPADASGLVIFAHGSGSSRLSPRNTFVAGELQRAGMGTLLVDLLLLEEDARPETHFDIPLLGRRLAEVTSWTRSQRATQALHLGYFGASTGAAAALVAASAADSSVRAIVSRGGRPDLAGPALPGVRAPTLFIVGGNDVDVRDLNEEALHAMHCHRKLIVVPGATHLFEEPGTLEEVARLAVEWFERWLK
ncbi:MAG: dienelactone [Planctomycetota bacterium]|nr:MAG: dienelactone [Planctomycetota bacterium]